MATLSAREFNQDVSAAKRAAANGPVFVTDRGKPAFVLLTIDDYRRCTAKNGSLVDRLAMSDEDYVDDDAFEVGSFTLEASEL